MDERDSKERSPEVAPSGSEQSEMKPAATRRRDALFRIARLATIPIAATAFEQACGGTYSNYSRYSEYCNGACRNYTHYGDSYCNYSDYSDTACYTAYCNGCCHAYTLYGSTYCNYSNYHDTCC